MLNLLKQLIAEKTKRFNSFEELTAQSDRRLKKLLKHVLTYSVFYKKYYADHGITLKDIEHIKIEDLPFTTKEILMKNFNEVSCDPLLNIEEIDRYLENSTNYNLWYKNNYKLIKTSGSSGSYGVFPYHKKETDIIKTLIINRVSYLKISPFKKLKLAVIVETSDLHAGISFLSTAPKMLYDSLLINVQETQEVINKKLNNFQPDILSGYANSIYLCAHEQLVRRLNIKLKQINCSAEPLTEEAQQVIKKAFGIPAINFYAASESFCMAASTINCQNLHINYDWNVLEAIDENGKKSINNTIGNAVLTNLYNYSFPLIRYKMNDKIAIDFGSCNDCESIFPVITKIEGRVEDTLKFTRPDGSEEYISAHFLRIFDESNIKSFQVIQTEENHLEIHVVIINKNSDAVLSKLDMNLKTLFEKKNLINSIRYTFVLVDEIKANPKTGKFAPIITFEKFQKQQKEVATKKMWMN